MSHPVYVRPGEARPMALNATPGLTGIGARVEDSDDAIVVARSTAGITEYAEGAYRKTVTFPTTSGLYVVVWDHPSFGEAVEEVEVTYSSPVAIRPAVDDVGAILRARTKDNVGEESGTFDETNRPTGAQVEQLIDQAVADVTMRTGTVPGELEGAARFAATLRAAMLVELSFFPEQSDDRLMAYQSLRLSYEEAVRTLVAAVQIRTLFAETEVA